MGTRIDQTPRIEQRLPPGVRLRRVQWDAAQVSVWRAWLSHEERARLDGYGVEKRRREFLLGRVAARTLLADERGCLPQAVPLVVAEGGAVDVADDPRHLSISHAGEEAAAVVARRAVGVDLERARPVLERPARMRRFLLAEEERPRLEALTLPAREAFGLAWALKEAALKALRCGLRRSPKTLRLGTLDLSAGTARVEAREQDRVFEGRFARDGDQWLAVVCEVLAG